MKNEIEAKIPFEIRAESLKKRAKEFFSTYENPSGSEDRLEICLIREGYRAVLLAEEEINRQKEEIERLKERDETAEKIIREQADKILRLEDENSRLNKKCENSVVAIIAAKTEAVKEFAKILKARIIFNFVRTKRIIKFIDKVVEETVGESDV